MPHPSSGARKAGSHSKTSRIDISPMVEIAGTECLLVTRFAILPPWRALRATDTTHFDAKSEPQRLLSPCPVFAESAESVILALFTAGLGNGHQPRKSGWCRNIDPSYETTSKLPNPEWIGLGPILVPQPAGPNAITASSG